MKGQLAHVTGLDKDKIVLVAQDVGGSFGVRGGAYPEYFAAMIAARKLGRPVKWVSSRAETFLSDWQGRALSLTSRSRATEISCDRDDRAILGAYGAALAPSSRPISRSRWAAFTAYRPLLTTRLATTHVAVSAYRGAAVGHAYATSSRRLAATSTARSARPARRISSARASHQDAQGNALRSGVSSRLEDALERAMDALLFVKRSSAP